MSPLRNSLIGGIKWREWLSGGWGRYTALPPLRRYLLLGLLIGAAIYLLWCRFGTKPPAPGQTVTALPPKKLKDQPRKTVTPKRLMVYANKPEAVKELGLDPHEAANPHEELQTATAVPPTRHGATTATFVNMSSGEVRTLVTANKAPWFAFERGNVVGVEVGIGAHGRYFQGDIQHDVFQVKGTYVGVKGSGTSYADETDWRIGIRAERRFDWP